MGFFLETVIGGLMTGMLYSLVALGFVLIFKASGVFNFAQGAMVFFAEPGTTWLINPYCGLLISSPSWRSLTFSTVRRSCSRIWSCGLRYRSDTRVWTSSTVVSAERVNSRSPAPPSDTLSRTSGTSDSGSPRPPATTTATGSPTDGETASTACVPGHVRSVTRSRSTPGAAMRQWSGSTARARRSR